MSNIAAAAVRQSVGQITGKNPAAQGSAATIAKGDFRQILPTLKNAAKNLAQTKTDSNTAKHGAAGAGASATLLVTTSQNIAPANAKTAKTGKKDVASQAQTGKDSANRGTAQAAATMPGAMLAPSGTLATQAPDSTVAAIGPVVSQTHADAVTQTFKQAAPAETAGKAEADAANVAAQIAQTSNVVTNNPTAKHAAASPAHTAPENTGVTPQLANALPQAAARPNANLTLHVILKPESLGAVTVKVQHSNTGDTNVTITASQPETLETLKKDVSNLNQILTNAGVPEAGRQIDFHTAPVAAAQPNTGLGNAADSSMQGNSGSQQMPQNGMGFANSSAAPSASAASPIAASPASLPAIAAGSVDMIA